MLFLFVSAGLPGRHLAADEAVRPVAVIYPDIGEPYRSVFATIIDGVEDRVPSRVTSIPVGASTSAVELGSELRRRDIHSVIALGRQGLKVATSLDRSTNVVAGGVLSVPEADAQLFAVHSLAPDPALLFARLKTMAPSVKRVSVVHDPRQNAWLIRLARDAAKNAGLELNALPVDDLKSAIKTYQELLTTSDPRRDAIWLPQDSIAVEDSTVLPLLLREAWDQNLLLFSSSVAHVKRGVLFALYPNNAALGRTLASAAQVAPAASGAVRGLQPLRDVLLAVNTRTAHHLGVDLASSALRVHLIFPEP